MPDKTYTYSIYQVNDDNKDLRFATLKSLGEREVNFADYDLVYSAEITANGRIKAQVLEDIYTAFNVEHPADFKGRSLSISDVVVMENDGEQTAHYCDNIGFFEVENFFEKRAVAVAEKPENPKEISKKVPSISEKLKAVQKPVVATKSEFPVVYVNDLNFAREHDEVEAWKISKTLNIECAAAIDEAIRANSKPGPVTGTQYVDTEKALKDVAGKFGIERVSAVTAAIVANQDWDGRLSQTNKNWAKGFEHPQNKVYVQTHLTIFDGFVNKVRNFEKILDKKPSISEQLQAKKPDITVKNDGVKRNKGDVDL
ncbi:MAG: YodL domain-containing protein [Oscillospiraceae bacterium]|nr:YodL domain-containing protein [Oscillospiraceae bacterium]